MQVFIVIATIVAFVAFLLALAGSLLAANATWLERLLMAGMTAGMAFVAAILLGTRDHFRQARVIRRVRQRCANRTDLSDTDFVARFPNVDPHLMAQTRLIVAQYFGVPETRLYSEDQLNGDLGVDVLAPGFQIFVAGQILDLARRPAQPFEFDISQLNDLGDLAQATGHLRREFHNHQKE